MRRRGDIHWPRAARGAHLASLIGFGPSRGARVRFFVSGVTQRWILPGLTVAYIFGVAASLWLAWDTPAFMPYVNFVLLRKCDLRCTAGSRRVL